MSIRSNVLVLLLSIITYFLLKLFTNIDLFKSITPLNNSQCIHLLGSIGNEDLQLNSRNILFLSSDNKHIFPTTPFSAPIVDRADQCEDGAVYYIDLNKADTDRVTKRIPFNRNYPLSSEPDFHPHGIHVSSNDKYLYVISHGRTGEVVFIFRIHYDQFNQPELLDFIYVIHDDAFTGVNNDLTAVLVDMRQDTDHLHVDNYVHTLYITSWLGSTLNEPAAVFYETLSKQSWGFITRCVVMKHSDSTNDNAIYTHQCHKLIHNLPGPNGIALINDNISIAVALTTTRTVQIYSLNDVELNHTSIQPYQIIEFDMAVDNINIDANSNDIIVAGHPRTIDFIRHSQDPKHIKSPNQISVIRYLGDHQYANSSEKLVVDEGNILSGSSAAVLHKNKLYIGGVHDQGVLVCHMK